MQRVYRRRRIAAAVVVVLLVLLVIGGVKLVSAAGGSASKLKPTAAGGPPATHAQPSHLPSPAVPLTAQRFHVSITTHPDGVNLTIKNAKAPAKTFTTPYDGIVSGGPVTLTLTKDGYNSLTQQLTLNGKRSLDLWLDEKGQLYHKLGEFDTGSNPKQVAFTPDGNEIWTTLLGGDGVQVFDSHTFVKTHEIKLGEHGGVEVIFNKAGTRAYVSQMETASIYEIDAKNYSIIRNMQTHSAWSKFMILSPDEKTLFVANWSGAQVTQLDLTTGQVVQQIPAVNTPRGMCLTPDAKTLFIAGYGHGEIQRVDLATGASKIILSTGGAMRHLVGDPTRHLLYADDMLLGEVYVIDMNTNHVVRKFKTDKEPNTIDLSPDGKVLYVSNRGANNPTSYYLIGPEWGSVLAIDTTTGKYLDAIVGGNQTTGLEVSEDGTLLAFSDFLDNRISVYSIPSYSVLANGHGGRYEAHFAEIKKQ